MKVLFKINLYNSGIDVLTGSDDVYMSNLVCIRRRGNNIGPQYYLPWNGVYSKFNIRRMDKWNEV